MHVEFLLEEPSAAAALENLFPKIAGIDCSFQCHVFQGKHDLLKKLPSRLKGYRDWLPSDWRIAVLVDRDNDDCLKLKASLDSAAENAGFSKLSSNVVEPRFRICNRIAVEELESWFFGDIDSLVAAYPGVPPTLAHRRGFRNPDAIAGGTWEKLERVLQQAGYYSAGMPKTEVARKVSVQMQLDRNRSPGFLAFRNGILKLIGGS